MTTEERLKCMQRRTRRTGKAKKSTKRMTNYITVRKKKEVMKKKVRALEDARSKTPYDVSKFCKGIDQLKIVFQIVRTESEDVSMSMKKRKVLGR